MNYTSLFHTVFLLYCIKKHQKQNKQNPRTTKNQTFSVAFKYKMHSNIPFGVRICGAGYQISAENITDPFLIFDVKVRNLQNER